MLDKVREYAMVKFAGDKASAEQFVAGFVKEAMSSANPPRSGAAKNNDLEAARLAQGKLDYELSLDKHQFDQKTRGGLGPMRSGFLNEAGKGMASLLVTAGVAGIGNVYNQVQRGHLHNMFLTALEKTFSSNELIRHADRDKVMGYANTVFRFAPNVSTDANVLSAVLTNAIHGEVMDTTTIKALTDLESRYTENASFTPKTYI